MPQLHMQKIYLWKLNISKKNKTNNKNKKVETESSIRQSLVL